MEITALILAGGAGTRLRSVVSDVPKPLAPVCGRPFLEYVLFQLRANGVGRAIICSGYRSGAISDHFGDGRRWGIELRYSVEAEEAPLGTAGALARAAPLAEGERLLALNGDSLFDIAIADLVEDHVRNGAALTLALATASAAGRYGSVATDADGWVTAFAEKPDAGGAPLVNGGVYVVERGVLDAVARDRAVSLERELLPALVGRSLRGRAFEGFFIDIGVPDDYRRAQADDVVWSRLARGSG